MMKKLLIFVLMLLATLPMSAKVVSGARDTSGVKFGFRGSFAMSSMNRKPEQYAFFLSENGNGIIKTRNLPAFAAGFAMDIPVVESFHINMELKYEQKGYRVTAEDIYAGDIETYCYLERDGYVEMPIQPQFRLNFSKNVHLNLNAGPYLAMALHGYQECIVSVVNQGDEIEKVRTFTKDSDKKGIWDDTNDLQTPYYRLDMGFAFGLDIVVRKFHVGTTFDLGVKDIYKLDYGKNSPLYTPVKNRTVLITLGWDF